jgi:hypothetical protein
MATWWTPLRLTSWSAEAVAQRAIYEADDTGEADVARNLESHFRVWAIGAFAIRSAEAVRRYRDLAKPDVKARLSDAMMLLEEGWAPAEVEARLSTTGQPGATTDPGAYLQAHREALAMDVAAGRLTMEEWARRYQGLAVATLTLNADPKSVLAMLDRTLFANGEGTAPRMPVAQSSADTSPIQAARAAVEARRKAMDTP